MAVLLQDNKVLLHDGKVAIDPTCCCVDCSSENYPSHISGSILVSFSGSCPNATHPSRNLSGSGTFDVDDDGNIGNQNVFLDGTWSDECATYGPSEPFPFNIQRAMEYRVYCTSGNDNPGDDGWYIHLFWGAWDCCGYSFGFGTTSDYDANFVKFIPEGGDASGTYTIPLTLFDGALGDGEASVSITITV